MADPLSLNATQLELLLADEASKQRKLEILFGPWWRHYAIPYEFTWTLYCERQNCPYCGEELGPLHAAEKATGGSSFNGRPHLDHMDPLSRGGEESIRNAAYVCEPCNLAKRNRLFVEWLSMLKPEFSACARQLYADKHGEQPETFLPAAKQPRLLRPRLELQFDESVLRKLFPKPIVDGPPRRR